MEQAEYPEKWDSEDIRKAYWLRRRWYVTVQIIVAGALVFVTPVAFTFDWGSLRFLWVVYGLLAYPYMLGGFQKLASLEGEPWKRLSLRRVEANVLLRGTRETVLAQCLRAIRAIGGQIISINAEDGHIVGAVGPDRLWNVPERVEVHLSSQADPTIQQIEVSSDDTWPAPEGLMKRNRWNIQNLIAELLSPATSN